jgi:hypothetical protein
MNKIQAHFYPDVDPKTLEEGTITYVSFQRLHQYLEQAVALRPGERLVGITVDGGGIKCKIDYKNPVTP